MSNATQQASQEQSPVRVICPSWCTDGNCRGDHAGDTWGTVATGGLPPAVEGPEPPSYNTACVRPQYPESDGLPLGVALFGSWGQGGQDWQVDLTLTEARHLAAAVLEACDRIDEDERGTRLVRTP